MPSRSAADLTMGVYQGYEAKGLATKDICYFVIDPAGKITKELWFEWPHVGFMHDCILSERTKPDLQLSLIRVIVYLSRIYSSSSELHDP